MLKLRKPTPVKLGSLIMIYSDHGLGKTYSCGQLDNTFFLLTEDGLSRVVNKKTGVRPASTMDIEEFDDSKGILTDFDDIKKVLESLAGDTQGFKNIVIDSLPGLEQALLSNFNKGKDAKDQYPGAFYSGRPAFKSDCFKFFTRLKEVFCSQGINVIFTAHAKQETRDEVDGNNYPRQTFICEKTVAEALYSALDSCWYLQNKLVVNSDTGKVLNVGEKILRMADHPAYHVKTRSLMDVPESIPFDLGRALDMANAAIPVKEVNQKQ